MESSEPDAYFDELPESINQARKITGLKKHLSDYLYHNSSITLLHSPVLDAYSHPDESERDFRMRLQQAAREKRDEEVDEVSARYEKRLDTLQDRLRRAEAKLATKEVDVAARRTETLATVGESVVGMLLGRRSTRVASRALSKQRQTKLAKIKLEEAEADVVDLQQDIDELEEELQEEVAEVRDRWEEALVEFEEVAVTPRRTDVQISLFGLAWAPHWQITYQGRGGATLTELVPAY
jgi:chromosome segregation ATPase